MLRNVTGCLNVRNYACPSEMVQYVCGNDISGMGGVTIWNGTDTLFNCSSVNRITLSHVVFDLDDVESGNCGDVEGVILSSDDDCYQSRLTFEATNILNGSMVRCLSGPMTTQIGETQELVIVGV